MTSHQRSAGPVFRQALTRVFPRNPNTHWLNVTAMLADVAFETDGFGRFAAFGQSSVLGYPASELIGKNIADFCELTGNSASESNSFSSIFASLSRQSLIWRGVVALERADGGQGNYQIFLAPKPEENSGARGGDGADVGMPGAYGLLIDLGAPELQALTPDADRAVGMLDPQTGLWSVAAFAEATGRRFDRLDVEGVPGTLLLLGFRRTPRVGHHAVLLQLAQELRDISRPTDILGRIDSTTLGLWCDGMDDLTGAERAAKFCQRLPAALPGRPFISVGLVARWPGNMEDPQTLITQADIALRHAEKVAQAAADAGSTEAIIKGTWRVWNPKL